MRKKIGTAITSMVIVGGALYADDALKALYKFDEENIAVAADSSVNGNDAALINNPQWVNDEGFDAMAFDKDDLSYLKCGTGASLSGLTDFTVSAWVKTTSSTKGNILFQRTPATAEIPDGSTGSYSLFLTGKGEVALSIHSDRNNLLTSTKTVRDGKWHHVLAMRACGLVKIYIDGVLDCQKDNLAVELNPALPLLIGAQIADNGSRYHFDGIMDEVTVRAKALSADEIDFYANVRDLEYDRDFDGDGLTNAQEYKAGTDIDNADNDGDGLNDKQELEYGTDPFVHNGNVKQGFELRAIGAVDEYTVSYDQASDSHSFNVRSGDIWNRNDNFVFVAKPLTNNSRLTVKLYDYANMSAWSKAGVMVRDSYDTNSKYGFTLVSGKNGSGIHCRKQTGGECVKQKGYGNQPMWLTIICHNGRVTSYVSDHFANGTFHWIKVGEQHVSFNADTKVGLAVASNNHSKAVQVKLSNLEVAPAADLDGDHITDWEENNVENTTAAFADTENDGSNDDSEIAAGTHPNFPETTIDSKTFHKRGLISQYFKGIYNKLPDLDKLPLYATGTVDQLYFPRQKGHSFGGPLDNGAASFTGKLYIETAGNYKFYTHSDDGSKLYINGAAVVKNDGNHRMRERSGSVQLTAGFHDLKIEYYDAGGAGGLKMFWEGPNFTKQVIPASVLMHAQSDYDAAFDKIDRDGDGLTDKLEDTYGSDKNKIDSNGDGLTDFEKYTLGLDPLKTDTDGDGISDYVEIKELKSHALTMEFDGTSEIVSSQEGRTATILTGDWARNGSSVYCRGRRGDIAFTADLPNAEIYKLAFDINDYYNGAYTTEFDIYLNGIQLDSRRVAVSKGSWTTVEIFTPLLKAGTNEVKLSWDNAHSGRGIQIRKIDLISMGGPDTNGNGTKDWIEYVISQHNDITIPAVSKVSPARITGTCRFPQLAAGANLVKLANDRVLYETALDRNNAVNLNLELENGGRTQTGAIRWEVTDIERENQMTILQGQSLLLTAGTVNQQNPATIDGTKVTEPLVKQFDAVGTFTITAVKANVNSSIIVKVLPKYDYADAGGHEKFIACRHGQKRIVNLAALGLTAADELEADQKLGFEQTATQLTVTIDGNCTRFITVKDKASGCVRGRIRLEGFQTYGIAQTSMYQLKIDESGSYHLEMPLIVNRNLPGVTHKIKVRLAGVILEDGSTLKEITADMLDQTGMIKQLFIKTEAARKTAGCHYLDMYQDGIKFGRIY